MRASVLEKTLDSLLDSRVPVYIHGPPGIGKSSVVHQVCRHKGLEVIDLRAVLLDPVDLRGLPVVGKSKQSAEWLPPAFLPLKGQKRGPGVIFADELAQAPPAVQAALLQGVLDHRIGEAELHPNWRWVAAGNRLEDRAGAHRLITPLLNRFLHLTLEVDADDWQSWALETGIDTRVRAFIRHRPPLLYDFNPSIKANSLAFASPRSWHFVSQVLPGLTPENFVSVVAGCVGDGVAPEFHQFAQMMEKLVDPEEVLRAPDTARVPQEVAVLHAIQESLVSILQQAPKDDRKLLAASRYLTRLPAEFGVCALTSIRRFRTDVQQLDCWRDFIRRCSKYFNVGGS